MNAKHGEGVMHRAEVLAQNMSDLTWLTLSLYFYMLMVFDLQSFT